MDGIVHHHHICVRIILSARGGLNHIHRAFVPKLTTTQPTQQQTATFVSSTSEREMCAKNQAMQSETNYRYMFIPLKPQYTHTHSSFSRVCLCICIGYTAFKLSASLLRNRQCAPVFPLAAFSPPPPPQTKKNPTTTTYRRLTSTRRVSYTNTVVVVAPPQIHTAKDTAGAYGFQKSANRSASAFIPLYIYIYIHRTIISCIHIYFKYYTEMWLCAELARSSQRR